MKIALGSTIVFLICAAWVHAQKNQPLISENDHKLVYRTEANGDRVPDFSYAGYRAGAAGIPDVPVRVVVSPIAGDNTARIQSAIDYVTSLSLDSRGAVLLLPGKFEVEGGLKITASGVVLRGSGIGENGTLLIATGHDRRTLITISGNDDRTINTQAITIADDYLPVGSLRLRVPESGKLKKGDAIVIKRPCTAEWVKLVGMNDTGGAEGFGWKPGTREVFFDRIISAVNGDEVTIDAPITTAIDSKFGGATASTYTWPGRISEVGVENMKIESTFDAQIAKDESHSWIAITMANVQDAWVRQVTMSHFAGGAVQVYDSCRRITVEDCKSLAPVSEIAGYRRHTFFTNGQQTLFQRCYSEDGRHDFSVGFCAAGPNAFVQCEAKNALEDSGPIDSWASGVLYDNVRIDGNAISLMNRWQNAQFAGWCAANSMLWNCSAALLNCFAPPGAHNWAVGSWGQFAGDGTWESSNSFANPTSLYYAQLRDRIGSQAIDRADWMMQPSDGFTNPTLQQAAQQIEMAKHPAASLSEWIDQAGKRRPIPIDPAGAKSVDEIAKPQPSKVAESKKIELRDGILVCESKPVTGTRVEGQWWRGGVRPFDRKNAQPCITRYVPGRTGAGLTDDLNELTDAMVAKGQVAFVHHYALWYDRRNDDHERVRRMNADAWPPFLELPFARSGREAAWDGLSKYDLTKYNPWYFDRLKQFADLCDQKGLVLIHEHFFQHNILEAGAHWSSSPWRSANNINNTGFPEPPNYAGDKRIFIGEQFYDLTNPTRRELYRAYIRKCLDTTADNSNVIHMTSDEYTGTLSFAQFWLDTIGQWTKDTGKKALVGLSAPKDVQDAILADPDRAKLVDVIDIQYWWYQSDGKLYAPQGGKNLSPRQWQRLIKPKSSSAEQVERAVREYREKFPDKAVMYSADGAGKFDEAVLRVGGSLAQVRK